MFFEPTHSLSARNLTRLRLEFLGWSPSEEAIDGSTRPLIHIHFPKTAGTTLNRVIASHLPPLGSFWQRSLAELPALPLARLKSFRFIAGHYGFTAADLLAFRNPIVFSMAHEPPRDGADPFRSPWLGHQCRQHR